MFLELKAFNQCQSPVSVPMLSTLKTYVNDRKSGIAKTAGFVGGLYITKHYISDRLAEVKARLEQERAARDKCVGITFISRLVVAETVPSLRRRFQQTQDDISYTVLALLPTLGDKILENMDVEAITRELQTRSKARNARLSSQASSSLASSIDVVQEHEVLSENGSVAPSVASTNFSLAELDSGAPTRESNGVQSDVQASDSAQDPMSSSIITTSTHDSAASGENVSGSSSQLVR